MESTFQSRDEANNTFRAAEVSVLKLLQHSIISKSIDGANAVKSDAEAEAAARLVMVSLIRGSDE